mmetsp:Transcript_44027/g.65299  ORF Transcript_44027/g.65299 Transcript_44027/m.65299 type:complete len:538 (-) Transcript_44027:97-1710(-)
MKALIFLLPIFMAAAKAQECSDPSDFASVEPTGVLDALIIGAGFSGLAAAKELQDQSEISFVVLEATDRVGGRVRSKLEAFDGYTVEEGANWVVDFPGNPIMDLARTYDLNLTQQDYFDIEGPYNPDGSVADLTNYARRLKDFRKAWGRLQTITNSLFLDNGMAPTDNGALALLQEEGWTAQSLIDEFIQWYYIDFEYAQNDVSLLTFPEDAFADPTYFVVDQRGYQFVAEKFAEDRISDDVLKLNHQVVKVEHDVTDGSLDGFGTSEYPARVRVTYYDRHLGTCGQYIVKRLISTVSAGYLAQNPNLFDPPIDSTLNPLKMKQYAKIFFQFTEKFWSDHEFIVTLSDSGNNNGCTHWQNLDTTNKDGNSNSGKKFSQRDFKPGSRILMCTLTTEYLFQVNEDGNVNENLLELLEPLRSVYPNGVEDYWEGSYYYQNLVEDEFFGGGAYTNWDPREGPSVFADYFDFYGGNGDTGFYEGEGYHTESQEWRVQISGTASCFENWGFVHGAYLAGERSARNLLFDLGYDIDTSSPCESF